MDVCSFLIECALFTAELYASRFLYKLYDTNAKSLKSLREAPYFEIDSKLQKEVEKNDGVIKYAVISGSIKALSVPLRSWYNPYLEGVIQKNVTKVHKVKWIRFLGSCIDRAQNINWYPL